MTLFFTITKSLTQSDTKIISCVDYVLGNLVNDSVERLQSIIDWMFAPESKQKDETSILLFYVRHFLKVEYDKHIKTEDGDGFHSLSHSLSKKDPKDNSKCRDSTCQVCKHGTTQVQCNGCLFPFWFCNHLYSHLAKVQDLNSSRQINENNSALYNSSLEQSMITDAKRAVTDCCEKFFFFMRHRHRVECQRRASADLERRMMTYSERTQGFSNYILMVIDFKMKFESMSLRETMPENFGKRGMGWHGVAAVYYEWNNDEEKSERKIIYADQVLSTSNKQDSLCVASLIESFVTAIIESFMKKCPFFPRIFAICSDNAGCYVNKFLILMIGLLNTKFYRENVFIETVIHSETQDGKGICDAHFATAMSHLCHFLRNSRRNTIRRINTPNGLATALAWNRGIHDSFVQLIQVDRNFLDKLLLYFKPICNKMKKYIGRVCNIKFTRPTEHEIDAISQLQLHVDFYRQC